ncbi:hypothetical protein [Spirosoma koreense]
MKTLLISLVALLCAVLYFRSFRFDFLDLTGPQSDITWEDITEDLCP